MVIRHCRKLKYGFVDSFCFSTVPKHLFLRDPVLGCDFSWNHHLTLVGMVWERPQQGGYRLGDPYMGRGV